MENELNNRKQTHSSKLCTCKLSDARKLKKYVIIYKSLIFHLKNSVSILLHHNPNCFPLAC